MKISNRKIKLKDKNGNLRRGRNISVSSTFNCLPEIIWEKVLDFNTLVEICKPKVSFKSISEPPRRWEENIVYKFKLFIYGFVPFGEHKILLESINEIQKEIKSKEHNKVIKIWNHLISMSKTENGKTLYTDSVELYSGIFTYFTALWSISLYKHRQKKWSKIVEKLNEKLI